MIKHFLVFNHNFKKIIHFQFIKIVNKFNDLFI